MMKIVFIFLFFTSFIFGNERAIPQVVLDAIKNAECLVDNGKYNPYFIRINRKLDLLTAKKNNIKMSGYILRCQNPKRCSNYLTKLLSLGIKNMDVGPFQINYMYFNDKWKKAKDFTGYFKENVAEFRARQILVGLIRTYGYSWRTLGRYHHYDPKNQKRNIIYYTSLYKYIEKAKLKKGRNRG